jgi:hypothetical protein
VIRQQRIDSVERTFAGTAFERQLVRQGGQVVISVDNTAIDDTGVASIRHIIGVLAKQLPGYDDEIPLGWLKFLDLANELVGRGKPHISLREARQLALACNVGDQQEASDRELTLMLHLHNCWGLLLHFDQPIVRELVVLHPQWLLDLMSALLCRRRIAEKQKHASNTLPEWRRLANEGRLDTRLMPEIWPELSGQERVEVLAYMETFGLCCALPGEVGVYVVPPLLPASLGSTVWKSSVSDVDVWIHSIHEDGEWDDAVGFFPSSLFFNLEVHMLRYERDSKQAMKGLFHDRMCIFGRICFMLETVPRDYRLRLTVRAESNSLPGAAFNRICDCLDDGLAKRYGVQYRAEIPCSEVGCNGIVVVNNVARCQTCRTGHGVAVRQWTESHPDLGDVNQNAITEAPIKVMTRRFEVLAMRNRLYDFFLNHCQASGQDQCRTLALVLQAAGASVWYDMQAQDLTARGMEDAVHNSRCVIIFLSDDVMGRPFCNAEQRWGKLYDCTFLGVVEKDMRHSPADFAKERARAPADLKHLLDDVEYIEYRRRDFEVRAMVTELLRRAGCTHSFDLSPKPEPEPEVPKLPASTSNVDVSAFAIGGPHESRHWIPLEAPSWYQSKVYSRARMTRKGHRATRALLASLRYLQACENKNDLTTCTPSCPVGHVGVFKEQRASCELGPQLEHFIQYER